MLREDYLLRVIRQAAEAIGKALGLMDEGQLDEAERSVDEAWRRLLKMPRDLFFMLDERTVSDSLGDPVAVRVAARACVAEAELLHRRGDRRGSAIRLRRALSLYDHVGVGEAEEDVAALGRARARIAEAASKKARER